MNSLSIETPRILLRPWQSSDLEVFTRMNADPEVMRYFPEPYPPYRTKAMFEGIQREFIEYGYGLYAAEEKSTGLFMGYIGFHRAHFPMDFCPCIEIGWRLNKHFWNRGYATEGAGACLEYGFTHLLFDTVYSFTAVLNQPSERVMQKIGMRRERHFDHPAISDHHPLRPHVLYTATPENMSRIRQKG